ncbi:MAG: hypothetical protein ACOYON_05220 [Fimbriimonas sp.]
MLSLLAAFVFEGGSGSALADTVRRAAGSTCVVSLTSGEAFRAFQTSFIDFGDLGRAFKKGLGLVHPDVEETVFCQPGYEPPMVFPAGDSLSVPPSPIRRDGSLSISAKRVSTSTGGSTFALASLQNQKFSKPIRVHWFIQRQFVAASASKERESTFLRLVALAAGAEFYESPKEYRIDFEPSEFRKRALFTYQAVGAKNGLGFTRADLAFSGAVLRDLSDEQLREVYKKPDNQVQFPMPINSELYKLAVGRLENDYADKNDAGADFIRGNVDFTTDGKVLVQPIRPPQSMFKVRGNDPNHWFVY